MQKNSRPELDAVNRAIATIDSALKRGNIQETLRRMVDHVITMAENLKISISSGFLEKLRTVDEKGKYVHKFNRQLAESAYNVLCRIKEAVRGFYQAQPLVSKSHRGTLHRACSAH